jgi:hypothetical protein
MVEVSSFVAAFKDASDDFGLTFLEDLGFIVEPGVDDPIAVKSSTVFFFNLGVLGVEAVGLSATILFRARDFGFDFVVNSFSDSMSLSLLNASDRLTWDPFRGANNH